MVRLLTPSFCIAALLCCVACSDDETTASNSTASGGSSAGGADTGGGPTGGGGQGGSGGAPGNGSCSYPGIPHPTDMLPDGIMPQLPTPASRAGFAYDPCAIATPVLSDGAETWVVSVTGDDNSAGNTGRGTIAAPRRTIPFGNFDAGTTIFILGDNSPYGTVDFDIGEDEDATFACTEGAPCWIVGVDQPRIARRFGVVNSTHVLIDGLSMVQVPFSWAL